MRTSPALIVLLLVAGCTAQPPRDPAMGRAPLVEPAYAPLPLGHVRPEGWLRTELENMASGMTGRLDEWYPTVGPRNGWVGGDGDAWERGPYWLDGLVPLAHILGDSALVAKARPYIEWTLASQQESGYFGPTPEGPGTENLPQEQRLNRADWWPRMVMLKVLQQHHEATGDERVIEFMRKYFRYQASMLPSQPLDRWTGWGKARGGENQASVQWLYDLTGDRELLDLGQALFDRTDDWTGDFAAGKTADDYWRTHVVNVAMAVKQPAVQYRQTGDLEYLDAVDRGLAGLMEKHGLPIGMFTGDEELHGSDPTHGTELCAVVEFMYSLEYLVGLTGRVDFADRLERVAYNALPTMTLPDYSGRQYFQQVNQVRIADEHQQIFVTGYEDATCFGLLTGYPCCTANLHQGWPKFVRTMWLRAPGGGLAAPVYGPSTVTTTVGTGGAEVTVREETNYPFEGRVRFTISTAAPVAFPLHLRVPGWATSVGLTVNGTAAGVPSEAGTFAVIDRTWSDGDVVELVMDLPIAVSRWHERSVAVERGPLLFALDVEGERREEASRAVGLAPGSIGTMHVEFHPAQAWNYGLLLDTEDPSSSLEIVRREPAADETPGFAGTTYPWTRETAPIRILAEGRRIDAWKEYNSAAGPLPPSPVRLPPGEPETVTLIPYGASTLRIAAFPLIHQPKP